MKIIIGAAILYCLLAVCSAQDAEAQWHLRAPVRGCVQVIYRIGGSTFLAYACDGVQSEIYYTYVAMRYYSMLRICIFLSHVDSCIFAPHVNRCPVSVAFQRPNFERIINIRATDHVVRFYMSFGKYTTIATALLITNSCIIITA